MEFQVRLPLFIIIICSASPVIGGILPCSPTVGVKLTSPQKLSVSIGISGIPWGVPWGDDTGMVFRLEPGLSGGKIHLGIRSSFRMIFLPVMSADICASMMYTWNNPWFGLENDQTYAGVEYRGGVHLVVFSAGVYRHIAGSDTDHDWVLSGGAGFGF